MNTDSTTEIESKDADGELPNVEKYRETLKSITSFAIGCEEEISELKATHKNNIQKATRKRDDGIRAATSRRDDDMRAATYQRDNVIRESTSQRDNDMREATSRRDEGIREATSRRDNGIRKATSQRDNDIRVNTTSKNLLPQAARVALQRKLHKLEHREEALEGKDWYNSVSIGDGSLRGCFLGAILGFFFGLAGCVFSILESGKKGGIGNPVEGIIAIIFGLLSVGVIGLVIGGIVALVRKALVESNNTERDYIKKEIPVLKNEIAEQNTIASENRSLRRRLGLNPDDFDVSKKTISKALAENEHLILKEYDRKKNAIMSQYGGEMESVSSAEEIEMLKSAIMSRFVKSTNTCLSQYDKTKSAIMSRFTKEESAALIEFDSYIATEAKQHKEKLTRLENQHSAKGADIKSKFDRMVSSITKKQPMLADGESLFLPAFPQAISAGVINMEADSVNNVTLAPNWLPFPVLNALLLDNGKRSELFDTFLLRLLVSLPEGGLHITVCDPVKVGQSFGAFSMLGGAGNALMTNGKVLISKEDIGAGIEKEYEILSERVKRVQEQLHTGDSWADYNKKHPETPLEYRLLIIYDVPMLLGEAELQRLTSLVEFGPNYGILPIIALMDKWDSRNFDTWLSKNKKHFKEASAWLYETAKVGGCEADTLQPDLPTDANIKILLQEVIAAYKKAEGQTRPLTALWSKGGVEDEMWPKSNSSRDGLEIPLGWDVTSGQPAMLRIDRDAPHTLLAGQTGAGKSNVLHVLINSLAHLYSPREVQVLLLDFKSAVEMSVYGGEKSLPHAELVAMKSDVEYGVSVLQHLQDVIDKRYEVFRNCSIRHKRAISSYSEMPEGERFPRWLLIVDEFHMLFSGRKDAEATVSTMEKLMRLGGAAGLHVLLATQTLQGLDGAGFRTLSTQIKNRVCVACEEVDSQRILGNSGGEELKSQSEAIINADQSRHKSKNVKLRVPHAKKKLKEEEEKTIMEMHLEELREWADENGANGIVPKVFCGNKLPELPGIADFARETAKAKSPRLWLGHELNYEEPAFFCELGRTPGANLLCVGGGREEEAKLRKGLLAAVARSISGAPCEVLYLSFRDDEEKVNFGELCGGNVSVTDLSAATPEQLAATLATLGAKRGIPQFLVIDGLDRRRDFYNEDYYAPPPSATALVKYITEGPMKSCWAVVFGDNWQNISAYRKLLQEFRLRAGFCMGDGNSRAFLGDMVTGLDKPNRAFFSDDVQVKSTWFRPFVEEENQESQPVPAVPANGEMNK